MKPPRRCGPPPSPPESARDLARLILASRQGPGGGRPTQLVPSHKKGARPRATPLDVVLRLRARGVRVDEPRVRAWLDELAAAGAMVTLPGGRAVSDWNKLAEVSR